MNSPFLPLVASAINLMQELCWEWVIDCLGAEEAYNEDERQYRSAEEMCEFMQAAGLPRHLAHAMIDVVYDKEPGELSQEAAGVFVSMSAMLTKRGIKLGLATITEYKRIMSNKDKIRGKQKTKAISWRNGPGGIAPQPNTDVKLVDLSHCQNTKDR